MKDFELSIGRISFKVFSPPPYSSPSMSLSVWSVGVKFQINSIHFPEIIPLSLAFFCLLDGWNVRRFWLLFLVFLRACLGVSTW